MLSSHMWLVVTALWSAAEGLSSWPEMTRREAELEAWRRPGSQVQPHLSLCWVGEDR